MLHLSRTQLALGAVVALSLGAVGVLSATGTAQPPVGPRTLHFVALEGGGFESKGPFGNGSVVGFRGRLKGDHGTTGRHVGICTITDLRRKESFCHVVLVLPNGRLLLDFLHRESAKSHDIAVVGGTGTYAGARGSAVAKEGRRSDITVSLLN
jgi:hypothetical protein